MSKTFPYHNNYISSTHKYKMSDRRNKPKIDLYLVLQEFLSVSKLSPGSLDFTSSSLKICGGCYQ